ncbi:MAG: acyl-CoA desaturase [Planctomycetia bacterium]|nr:acyl-CoA desaturase [Planctomycetia bacterium]
MPFLGVIAAGYLLWGGAFHWLPLCLLVGMYVATALGITVGFHRLFTHRSFETNALVQAVLGALGSMAIQGPLIQWVAQHRHHHQESDTKDDPHSPHLHGHGFVGFIKGLWHSHVGWCFEANAPSLSSYVPDLMKNRTARRISQLFPLWALLSLAIPTGLGWAVSCTWTGALLGFIWGGLVRIFFVHHVTWSINSICHLWGSRPYPSGDESRNNFIFGVLAMGEGWHNNHHAFPTSARHGLAWWQIDFSYLVIRLLALCGLAWNIKVPSPQYAMAKRMQQVK